MERILRVVDSVLLLVDAVEGPMPQTRFVTQKSLALGLKPIVVVNKIDRPAARPDWVLGRTLDLFDELGASDEQLDFHIVYASGLAGYSGPNDDVRSGDMTHLLTTIVEHVSPPQVELDGAFQLQTIALAYDKYKGIIGTGRVQRGRNENWHACSGARSQWRQPQWQSSPNYLPTLAWTGLIYSKLVLAILCLFLD